MKKKDAKLAVIDGETLTRTNLMDAMDGAVRELYQTSNIDRALHILDAMRKIEDVSGLAKARLLYGMKNWWDETKQGEVHNDTFQDFVESRSHGLSSTNVVRYVRVQENIENLDIPKEFHDRPIRELIPISNALHQGYEIPKDVWDEISLASNASDVGHIIREKVKKKPSKKSALSLVLERDGTISLWIKNRHKYVGYLNLEDTDEDVQKAIERIIGNASIRRK